MQNARRLQNRGAPAAFLTICFLQTYILMGALDARPTAIHKGGVPANPNPAHTFMTSIYLTGPRACGKNTVGILLAASLGADFLDMDDEIMRRNASTIAEIVQEAGWPAFRRLETALLLESASYGRPDAQYAVIATGGGVVLAEENRRFLQSRLTIYLEASPQTLARRLLSNPDQNRRPSLTGQKPHEEIARVLAEREALYKQTATLTQPAEGQPEQIAQAIHSYIKSLGQGE